MNTGECLGVRGQVISSSFGEKQDQRQEWRGVTNGTDYGLGPCWNQVYRGPGRHLSQQRSSCVNNLHRGGLWAFTELEDLSGQPAHTSTHSSISLRGSRSCLKTLNWLALSSDPSDTPRKRSSRKAAPRSRHHLRKNFATHSSLEKQPSQEQGADVCVGGRRGGVGADKRPSQPHQIPLKHFWKQRRRERGHPPWAPNWFCSRSHLGAGQRARGGQRGRWLRL